MTRLFYKIFPQNATNLHRYKCNQKARPGKGTGHVGLPQREVLCIVPSPKTIVSGNI